MRRLFFIGIVGIVIVLMTSCRIGSVKENYIQSKSGELDLSQWDFITDGIAPLNGEWEFYWNQLLEPKDFSNSTHNQTGYITLPGTWNAVKIGDKRLPGDGYATMRLRVRLKKPSERLMVFMPFALTSYRLWVNGEAIITNGVVSASPRTAKPLLLNKMSALPSNAQEFDIILQISNFSHVRGGIEGIMEIGNEQMMLTATAKRLAFDLFIIGGLLLMGFYHFSLYIFRKKDISTLYFSLTCFLFALFSLVNGERFLNIIYPNAGWEFLVKLDYIPHYMVLPVFLLFLCSLFPKEDFPAITKGFVIMGVLFVSVVMFFPAKVYIYTLPLYEVLDVLVAIYIIIILIRASIHRQESAKVMLLGFLFLAATIVNDILYSHQVIMTAYLIPVGFFLFIMFQSYVMSLRISNAFVQVELFSEKLVALDHLKDEFMANTSHELRTPLNGIIGIAQSLYDGVAGVLTEQAKHNLMMIIGSGKRLTNLINDILDFSHLKNRNISLNQKPLIVYDIVDMVIQISGHLKSGKNITLVNDISRALPLVYADEDRLQQILLNLIGNAIKYTEEGRVVVTAEVEEGMCVVHITDTGIGIPHEQFERIFMPFEQASNAQTLGSGGSGIGLAITKKLIELHRGTIRVESEVGKGSTFSFSLPLYNEKSIVQITGDAIPIVKHAIKPHVVTTNSVIEYSQGDLTQSTVLIVDDDPVNLQVLLNHLVFARYTVLKAENGPDALKIIEETVPDIVLLDVMMPKMSGYEVAIKIREKFSLMDMPILMLTAKNQPQDIVNGLKAGANDYLVKPFDKDELLARVRTLAVLHALNCQIQHEIALREDAERERAAMSEQLTTSLTKALSGFIHICAGCKKVHDKDGWKSVEGYIETHTDAQFSHSICPDCRKKMYDDLLNNG